MRRLAPAMSAEPAAVVPGCVWQSIASASVLEVKLNSGCFFEAGGIHVRAMPWALRMIAVGPATTNNALDCCAAGSAGAAVTAGTIGGGGTPPCDGDTMDFGAPPPLRSAVLAGEPRNTANATATAEPPINAAKMAVRNKVRRAFTWLIACRSKFAFSVDRNFLLGSARRRCRKSSFGSFFMGSPLITQRLNHPMQNGADVGFG